MFMKKLFIALAITVISTSAMAQGNINKGNVLMGGQAGFSSSSVKDVDGSTTSIEFSPNIGYFFANQFAGGLRMSFDSMKESDENEAASSFLFAPFIRYYFMPAANKVNLFADASYGFGSIKYGESHSINQFSIMAGPSIFLNPSAALEIGLGYSSQGGHMMGDSRLNTIGLKVGFQIHLGGGAAK
jgi:hypothetical protein